MKNEGLIKQYIQERKQSFSNDCRGGFIKSIEKIHDNIRIGKIHKYSFPFTAFWAITESCNLHCSHCYASARVEKNKKALVLSDAFFIVDNLYKNGIWEIVLEGGEPFMYPEIDSLIQYIKSKGIVLTILTNATLFNEKHINVLQNHLTEYDLIQVSLDGYGVYNDDIRGVNTYNRVMEFLQCCGNLSNRILINCVVTESNVNSIEILCSELVSKTSIKKIHFSPLMETGRGYQLEPVQHIQAIHNFLQIKRKFASDLLISGSVVPDELFYDSSNKAGNFKLGCCAARSKIFIDSQGFVYPCEHMPNANGYSMLEKDIKTIWNENWNDWSTEAYNVSKLMYEKKQFIPFCPGSSQYAKNQGANNL